MGDWIDIGDVKTKKTMQVFVVDGSSSRNGDRIRGLVVSERLNSGCSGHVFACVCSVVNKTVVIAGPTMSCHWMGNHSVEWEIGCDWYGVPLDGEFVGRGGSGCVCNWQSGQGLLLYSD